ncbi:MAG TPA: LON peptidase substrate-binding domain-containing protein [Polyangia bacterium]|nr:LON peptidase substrate-binding domain-containing protein [Polyangia bacterium]
MTVDTTEARLAAALTRMPLFPLPNVVLFPHASLRLHIFEDRYRALTRDILAGERFLAMGLIVESASPSDERPAVEPIAGVGEVVMAHELPDGRFNLVVRGHARVRIDEELASDHPYRLVAATVVPDLPISDRNELRDAEQALRVMIGQLADAIPEGGEPLRQIAAALETPAALADVSAAELIADLGVRQQLLETRDVAKRLERVSAEIAAMMARLSAPGILK